jgi:hypothetical protein
MRTIYVNNVKANCCSSRCLICCSNAATPMMQHPQHLNHQNSHVKRRLFQNDGDSENGEPTDNVDTLDNNASMAQEKWNFDFINEVPLEGDWEWEKVTSESD